MPIIRAMHVSGNPTRTGCLVFAPMDITTERIPGSIGMYDYMQESVCPVYQRMAEPSGRVGYMGIKYLALPGRVLKLYSTSCTPADPVVLWPEASLTEMMSGGQGYCPPVGIALPPAGLLVTRTKDVPYAEAMEHAVLGQPLPAGYSEDDMSLTAADEEFVRSLSMARTQVLPQGVRLPEAMCLGCGALLVGDAIHKCGGCMAACYCGRECQSLHRKQHKKLCYLLR